MSSIAMEASVTGKLLAGHVAVLSGGLGDIGRATAFALAAAGARVALCDIRPVAEARRLMPGFDYTRVDVTRHRAIEKWIDAVERRLGTPTLAICNAAIVEPATGLQTSPALWRRTLDINLSGAFFLAQAVARKLVERSFPGRIVMVGSWAAHAPHGHIVAYSVAKAGLRMAMKCLAVELAAHKILVNEIAPGKVDAGLSAQLFSQKPSGRRRSQRSIPTGQLLSGDDVAAGVLHLCHPDNRHMSGSVYLMDGGLSALLPRLA